MLHFTKNILQCAFKVTTISLKYLRSFFHNNIQDHLRIVLVTNNYIIIIYQTEPFLWQPCTVSLFRQSNNRQKKAYWVHSNSAQFQQKTPSLLYLFVLSLPTSQNKFKLFGHKGKFNRSRQFLFSFDINSTDRIY